MMDLGWNTDLCDGLEAAGELELVDAMVHGLAVGGALGHGAFAAPTAHAHTVDDIACQRAKTEVGDQENSG